MNIQGAGSIPRSAMYFGKVMCQQYSEEKNSFDIMAFEFFNPLLHNFNFWIP